MRERCKTVFAIGILLLPGSSGFANDWPQWGGGPNRNNFTTGRNIPTDWHCGKFDRQTGQWDRSEARNIKWTVRLGSQSYGSPVVANGQIYVGTNNGGEYLERARGDYGCLLCFRESDGEFLWQYSSEKLPSGRVHDWPMQGIVSSPLVDQDRMWFVNNRGEVVCADTHGFHDDEDDGPITGIRARLFRVAAGISNQSRLGKFGSAGRLLRAIAGQANLEMPSYFSTRKDEAGRVTILSRINRTYVPQFTVEHSPTHTRLVTANAQNGVPAGTELTSVPADLMEGISSGGISKTLAYLLGQHGIDVAGKSEIREVEANRKWTMRFGEGDTSVEIQLERDGGDIEAFKTVSVNDRREADVVWTFDMMNELGVRQHNLATCSVTSWGDTIFVCTSNGVDESHVDIPAPVAPSFIALNRHTGKLIWADSSPGKNILHGQWSAPAVAKLGGVPQVIFCGGDGWVYSFRADQSDDGKPELLWKFDGNPKGAQWKLGGAGTRNNIVAVPVINDGRVYVAMGQDPEHGEGNGHLWCLDPTKRGDVSAELVIDANGQTLPHFRINATAEWGDLISVRERRTPWEGVTPDNLSPALRKEFREAGYELPEAIKISGEGDERYLTAKTRFRGSNTPAKATTHVFRLKNTAWRRSSGTTYNLTIALKTQSRVVPNPNSAVAWHYEGRDWNNDGQTDFHEEFHRCIGSVAISGSLLFAADHTGIVHCLDASNGRPHWTCDILASCWSTPLIVNDKVYVADEDGDVAIFEASPDPELSLAPESSSGEDRTRFPKHEMFMNSGVYSTPVVANDVLYIIDRQRLYAIAADGAD